MNAVRICLGYLLALLLVCLLVGNAMRVSRLDDQCTRSGGKLEGLLQPECVYE